MTGQNINNYTIERKLGEGGMGNVYFARHNRIDRVVAIKVLHQNLFSNESIRNRFKNEANALIKLTHTNIVKIYDYVEQDNLACLIIEYIEGYTLDEYITKVSGPLPAGKATYIICEVLEAVQYAHEHNVYHRDIKPGNIMLSRDGKTVKIMDFGIAKFTDASKLKTTHANAQLGTPFYMSPEQVKGMPYTPLSDIYSLGVTLFEMVTGKCPYMEITNLFELQSKIVNEPLPPTDKYYPNVLPKIQNAIKITTHKIPGQRFKNCNDFKNFLLEEEKVKPAPLILPVQERQPKPPQPQARQVLQETTHESKFIEEIKKSDNGIYLIVLFAILAALVIFYIVKNTEHSGKFPSSSYNNIEPEQPDTIRTTTGNPIIKETTPVVHNIIKTEPVDSSTTSSAPPPSIPTGQRVLEDFDTKSEAKLNLISRKVKFSHYYTFEKDGGKQWSASMNFKIGNRGEYNATVIYDKTEDGYIYKTSSCKAIKETQLPTVSVQPVVSTDKNNDKSLKRDVKGDLMNSLEHKKIKTVCGIQYNNTSEITISNVGEAQTYDESGNTSYDVDITIHGMSHRCQVIYIPNSDTPNINCLF